MTTAQVAVRLPAEQIQRIDGLVGTSHESRSDVIRRALDLYLYRLECESDARIYEVTPLTETELALGDDPDSWQATPAW
jgi:Arc/MetJ-type ribon-helix-helix transcriptional regulator